MTCFGLKKSQDLGNRAAHPHQEFPGVRSTSPPPPSSYLRSRVVFVSANYKSSLLSFQRSMLGFPGIPGSNGIPGVPGVPGPHGPQGREGVKGQIGDKGSQGMPGPRGDRGHEGPPGKSGSRGIQGMKGERGAVGIKGERGIVGNQGRKGDKGEKGESAKASQGSVVPQTNWKQCVWKSQSYTDNAKIKVIRIRIINNSSKENPILLEFIYFREKRLPSHSPFDNTLHI